MNARVVARVTINARPAEVFGCLVNLESHYIWNPHLQRISPIVTLKKGTTYSTTSVLLGVKVESQVTVARLIRDKQLVLTSDTGSLHYTVVYQLVPEEDQTVVVCNTQVSASTAFSFTKPILKLLAHRELQSDLRAFKQLIEEEYATPVEA